VTLIALKDLPNGVRAGASYEERDGIAAFLIAQGVARKDEPDDVRPRVQRLTRRSTSTARLTSDPLLDE